MPVAFKGLLRCLQFGLVAVRAQQAARKRMWRFPDRSGLWPS
jgi:hypothetical protein